MTSWAGRGLAMLAVLTAIAAMVGGCGSKKDSAEPSTTATTTSPETGASERSQTR